MHKCMVKFRPFNQSEYIFIVGQLRTWEIMKNIKRFTSSIKLPFLVFQYWTLNFGPLKERYRYLHTVDFSGTSDEVAICSVRRGRVH